jgi:predicted DNA-binding transcriptional regulator AlpA
MLPVSTDRLFNSEEAAEYLGVSDRVLSDWRYRRQGPAYVKLGHRTVRYRPADLEAFATRSRVVPRSDLRT